MYFLYNLFLTRIELLIPEVTHGLERFLILLQPNCFKGACLSIVADNLE